MIGFSKFSAVKTGSAPSTTINVSHAKGKTPKNTNSAPIKVTTKSAIPPIAAGRRMTPKNNAPENPINNVIDTITHWRKHAE